jgi:DNA (cytosine-5)-methyltransferase 1
VKDARLNHRRRHMDGAAAMGHGRGVVELFAGLGCVAQGFAATGKFEILGLTDIDPRARNNTIANLTDVPYLEADAANLTIDDLRNLAGGREIAGILGCPPCQGFSAAGQRDAADPRNRLLGDYFRLVADVQPEFFVMENVPTVLWRTELADALTQLNGTNLTRSGVLNAALYGLPQTRQRAILIGYRRDLDIQPTGPVPTHGGSRKLFNYRTGTRAALSDDSLPELLASYPLVGVPEAKRDAAHLPKAATLEQLPNIPTVREAMGDLPRPGVDGYAPGVTPSAFAAALRQGAECIENHSPWGHRRDTIDYLEAIPEGGVPGASFGRNPNYYSQAYARLHRDGLALTVTTNFHNPGSGRFTHYAYPRSLTVREAARLQGLPDIFVLTGDRSTQERLVGNAFPMPWAQTIASHVARQLATP